MADPTPQGSDTPSTTGAPTPSPENAITANPSGAPAPLPGPPPVAAIAPHAPAAAPPKPPGLPPKPAPPKPPAKGSTRRGFFIMSWFAIAWVTLSGSLLAMVLGTVRFLFPNVLSEPPSSFKAGAPEQYEDGKVDDRFKTVGAWVIRARNERDQETIYALSTTCTHLGCTPNWLEGEKKFKCPCHGSGFRITGVNFEGPAPRPLERYAIRLGDDGQIVVDKSRKFQKELGQWSEPDSFILLG